MVIWNFKLWCGFLGFFFLYKKDKTFKSWLEFYILLVLGLMLDYTELTVVVELVLKSTKTRRKESRRVANFFMT